MKHDYGYRKVLNEDGLLNVVALSIQNENPATRLAALNMLAMAAADVNDGGIVAMDSIHHLSSVAREPARFITLMRQLKSPDCPVEYQIAGMQLISNVVNFAPDLNMLVYWQMDLERAGVDEVISVLEESSDETVSKLAKAYKAKLVNVDDIVASREENYGLYVQGAEEVAALQMTVESLTKARDDLRTQFKVRCCRARSGAARITVLPAPRPDHTQHLIAAPRAPLTRVGHPIESQRYARNGGGLSQRGGAVKRQA